MCAMFLHFHLLFCLHKFCEPSQDKLLVDEKQFSIRLDISIMDTSFRTIYIENFPLNASEKLLERLFSKFGPIKHINMPTFEPEHPLCRGLPKPKTKGYAFVEFSKRGDADQACRFFNDLNYIKLAARLFNGGDIRDYDELACESSPTTQSIIQNLEFRKLLLLRVMPKDRFQELSKQYNEKKLQSLINAARLLMVT